MKKSFKLGIVAVFIIAAGIFALAFAKPSQPKTQPVIEKNVAFAQFYRFDGTVCFPLTTQQQRDDAIDELNTPGIFVAVGSLDCPIGNCLCGIFVPTGTSLSEAIEILIKRINALQSIEDGQTYTDPDNAEKSVTVELKAL